MQSYIQYVEDNYSGNGERWVRYIEATEENLEMARQVKHVLSKMKRSWKNKYRLDVVEVNPDEFIAHSEEKTYPTVAYAKFNPEAVEILLDEVVAKEVFYAEDAVLHLGLFESKR